jgi:hypothetical protein
MYAIPNSVRSTILHVTRWSIFVHDRRSWMHYDLSHKSRATMIIHSSFEAQTRQRFHGVVPTQWKELLMDQKSKRSEVDLWVSVSDEIKYAQNSASILFPKAVMYNERPKFWTFVVCYGFSYCIPARLAKIFGLYSIPLIFITEKKISCNLYYSIAFIHTTHSNGSKFTIMTITVSFGGKPTVI